MFNAVPIETYAQLTHVSRYIHLNPYVSEIIQTLKDLENYSYSSYPDYIGTLDHQLCVKEPVLDFFKEPEDYQEFIVGHSDYAKELERMKHLLLDPE